MTPLLSSASIKSQALFFKPQPTLLLTARVKLDWAIALYQVELYPALNLLLSMVSLLFVSKTELNAAGLLEAAATPLLEIKLASMFSLDKNIFDEFPISPEFPDLTTATLETYIPEIKDKWELASQSATLEGVPYSRTYSLLSFPPSVIEPTLIDKVELPYYDEEFEGTSYFRLSNSFLEDTYSASTPDQAFYRWQKTTTKWRQELIYLNKPSSLINWVRPSIQVPRLPPSTLPPQLQYLSIATDPFVLPPIRNGGALEASITVTPSNSPIDVSLTDDDGNEIKLENFQNILLTLPYLNIRLKGIKNPSGTPAPGTVNNVGVTHTSITIQFYGEFSRRVYIPGSVENEQILLHADGTNLADRLKPPGLSSLPDNFWNTNAQPVTYTLFQAREGVTPAWN